MFTINTRHRHYHLFTSIFLSTHVYMYVQAYQEIRVVRHLTIEIVIGVHIHRLKLKTEEKYTRLKTTTVGTVLIH